MSEPIQQANSQHLPTGEVLPLIKSLGCWQSTKPPMELRIGVLSSRYFELCGEVQGFVE